MAYSGKYNVKNKQKYKGKVSEVFYRSFWELCAFKWCDNNSQIKEWSSEEVVIPYFYEVDKCIHRYFIDLYIKFKDGTCKLIEIKPDSQTKPPKTPKRKTKRYINECFTYVKNQNKWDFAKEYAEERGWTFEIWTEVHLEKLGILPKSLKPLKPFKKKKK